MDFMEVVARWRVCEYGEDKCLGENKCLNYIWVDPRTESKKGIGPSKTGQRTLCSLLDDLSNQIMERPGLND
ncbi:hypothetical protein ACFLVX_03505 [Chloroflexota bacterium]